MKETEMTIEDLRSHICLIKAHLYFQGKPIAYVSGKVTGLAEADVTAKFQLKQDELEAKGYAVFNPVQWIPVNFNWQMAMRVCVAILPICESIWMLKDWANSKGACEERRISEGLGLLVYGANNNLVSEPCKHEYAQKTTHGYLFCDECGQIV